MIQTGKRHVKWKTILLTILLPVSLGAASGRELAGQIGLTAGQQWRLFGITRAAHRRYPSRKWPKFREAHFSASSLNEAALYGVFTRRIAYRTAALARVMYVNKRFYGSLDGAQKSRLVEYLRRDASRKRNKIRKLTDYERRWFQVQYDRAGVPTSRRPALESARRRMARLRARTNAASESYAKLILRKIRAGQSIEADLNRMNDELRVREAGVARAKMKLLRLFQPGERRAVLADFTHMMNKRNL